MVLDAAGKPVPGVEVFAYQTDQHGVYAAPGAADPWRLKGWAVTDAQGRFEFRTIRPAAYPSNTVPGHVHLTFKTTCCGRQVTEVMFDDDPLVTPAMRQREGPGLMFGKVTKTRGWIAGNELHVQAEERAGTSDRGRLAESAMVGEQPPLEARSSIDVGASRTSTSQILDPRT